MLRERVTEDIYVFISELYVEVAATVILAQEGAVVVDTLPFPQETQQMRDFALRRSPRGIRYLVNTHHHADHVYGSCLFPEAELIAHRRCREIMLKVGEESLQKAKAQNPLLASVELCIPQLVFETELLLRLGDKTVHLIHAPGHSPDGLMVHVPEDKVLIANDIVTPVPFVMRGNPGELIQSLRRIKELNLENAIQGHGGVLLRGEINETVDANIAYLQRAEEEVRAVIAEGRPRTALAEIDIEACGLSRIPLGGLVQRFHQANLEYLYDLMIAERKGRAQKDRK
jgi:glyoxylase-like metal-dependent hydrolase (beta-lactamase superfamily II)